MKYTEIRLAGIGEVRGNLLLKINRRWNIFCCADGM